MSLIISSILMWAIIFPTYFQENSSTICPDTLINRGVISQFSNDHSLEDFMANIEAAWEGPPILAGFATRLNVSDEAQILGVDTHYVLQDSFTNWSMEILSLSGTNESQPLQVKFTVFVNERKVEEVFEGNQSSITVDLPIRQTFELPFTLPEMDNGIYDVLVIGHPVNTPYSGDIDVLSHRFTLLVGETADIDPRSFTRLEETATLYLPLQGSFAYIGIATISGESWSNDIKLAKSKGDYDLPVVIPYVEPLYSMDKTTPNQIAVMWFDNGEYLETQYIELDQAQILGSFIWQYPLGTATVGTHSLIAVRVENPGLAICTNSDSEPLMGYGIQFEVIP